MKKILILISLCSILNGCCNDCGEITQYPYEGFIYELNNNSIVSEATSFSDGYSSNTIAIKTNYELPKNRSKDILSIIILFFNNPELSDNMDVHFAYDDNTKINIYKTFYDYNGTTVNINSNYDPLIIDPMDTNYYTTTLTFYVEWLGLMNKAQIHLRQELEPTTKISYMITAQPFKDQPYEYIAHTMLENLDVRPTNGTKQPLPDILK